MSVTLKQSKVMEIIIKPDGEIVAEAFGYSGMSCEKLHPFHEKLGVITSTTLKDEYYQMELNSVEEEV